MSEQRGGGVSLLKGLKRNLPELGKVASLEDAERQIMPGSGGTATVMVSQPEAPAEAAPAVPQDVPRRTYLLGKKKKYTTTFTLRMDLELHKKLKAIAEYNEVEMTAIINEAIEFHLANFEAPPAGWRRGRRS